MDVLGFVVPELSRLDLSVLTASASALYSDIHSDLSAPKRQKLRAAKEAHSHKYVRYDIWLGAVHVVLPESNSASVDETRSILSALLSSDVAIRSDPKRVEAGAVLDATSIYDNVSVSVSSANVLLTNGEREWMRREVQEEQNLYIVDDFNLEATIGLSIAPSEVGFARTRVAVESEMMCVRLTREKYLAVMRFARAFGRSVREVVESSEVDFASLKAQAIQMASNAMAVDKSISETVSESVPELNETITPSEEITTKLNSPEDDLQHSHFLSVAVHITGVSVLIEEVPTANEHMAIVKTAIAGLAVSVEQRTFDSDVVVSLNRIEVKDCLQSLSKREERFLVVSRTVNAKGEIDRDSEQDLFKVTVAVVKPCSPDYASASSDVSVHVCFGSLSGGSERGE